MRAELASVVATLIAESERTREVTLDAIGDAIGVRAVSTDDVDQILRELESRGRRIVGPEGGTGEAHLKTVLVTARTLLAELGRKPTIAEISERASMSESEVRHALFLSRIMQR